MILATLFRRRRNRVAETGPGTDRVTLRGRRAVRAVAGLFAMPLTLFPLLGQVQVKLHPETLKAFHDYTDGADQQFARRLAGEASFLWSAEDENRTEELSAGKIIVEPSTGTGSQEIPRGIIHDWTAAMLVRGVDAEQLTEIVSSYDTHARTYSPSVTRSRILERDGSNYRVSMRMLKKSVMTAVLETEHLAEFDRLDDRRWWGRSRSISIREVHRPGTPNESLRPAGHDRGFLWRLNVYWRFAETPDGTIAEHRAVTLTRDFPKALQWMLQPVLVALPRRSLTDMMALTRDAAQAPGD